MGDVMLIIMDNEIETGMEIRKLNEDDNYYTKIEEGYKGFLQVNRGTFFSFSY